MVDVLAKTLADQLDRKRHSVRTSALLPDDSGGFFQDKINEKRDEREDVQEKTFKKWINAQLGEDDHGEAVDKLFNDLRSGHVLIRLISRLTNIHIRPEIGNLRVHHIENINKVLDVLRDQGVKLINVDSNDIVEGSTKLTLGLIWSIIVNWQVKRVMQQVKANVDVDTVEEALLVWCNDRLNRYGDVAVSDFSSSWKDGRAFLGLVHHKNPDLFDFDVAVNCSIARDRLSLAFKLALDECGIEPILDVDDFEKDVIDRKSVMTYVMSFVQPRARVVHCESSEMESVAEWIQSAIVLKKFLDETEEEYSSFCQDSLINSPNDLIGASEQLRLNEDKMFELTSVQNKVEALLLGGTRLLTSPPSTAGKVSESQEEKIKSLMHSISLVWETIRNNAMLRREHFQSELSRVQSHEVDKLDKWLDSVEVTLMNLSSPAVNYEMLERQMSVVKDVQLQLESRQSVVSELQRLVFIDGDCIESTKAGKVLDRWSATFRFVDNRLMSIQELMVELKEQEDDLRHCERWISETERSSGEFDSREMEKVRVILRKARVRDEHMTSAVGVRSRVRRIADLEARLSSACQRRVNSDNSPAHHQVPSSIAHIIRSATGSQTKPTTTTPAEVADDQQQQQPRRRNASANRNEEAAATHKDSIRETCKKFSNWLNEVDDIIKEDRYGKLDNHEKYFAISDMLQKFEKSERELESTKDLMNRLYGDDVTIRRSYERMANRWTALRSKVDNAKKLASLAVDGGHLVFDEAYVRSELDPIRQKVFLCRIGSADAAITTDAAADNNNNKNTINNPALISEETVKTLKDRLAYLLMLVSDMERGHGEESVQEIRTEIHEIDQRLDTIIGDLTSSPSTTPSSKLMNVPIHHHHHHQAVMTSPVPLSDPPPSPPHRDQANSSTTAYRHHPASSSSAQFHHRHDFQEQQQFVSERSERTFEHEETTYSSTTANNGVGALDEEDDNQQTNLLHTLTKIYNFPGCTDEEQPPSSNYNIHSIVEIHDHHHQQEQTTAATHHLPSQPAEQRRIVKDSSASNTHESEYKDAKAKFVAWLESIESLLLADSFFIAPIRTMESRKNNFDEMYADVMEKTADLEHVKRLSREYAYGGVSLSQEEVRNTELELNNLADRLSDAAIFVKDRSQKFSSAIRQLSNHEQDVSSVRQRLTEMDAQLRSIQQHKHVSTASIQSQITTANGLLDDARVLQSSIDRISETAADIARVSVESFASKIKAEADGIAQHWSRIVSHTKQQLNSLQTAFNTKRGFEDSALEIEVWLSDRNREAPNDDGPIYYPEQIEERLSKYRHMLSELIRKQDTFNSVVTCDDEDEHSREMAKLKQSWLNLRTKVENKIRHYEDVERYHAELKTILNEENEWLSMLQSKTFSSSISSLTDPDVISEELNALERLVNQRPRINRQRVSELNKTLEVKRVMIPALGNQIRQFEFRWDQLHEDALKRIEVLEDSIREGQRIQKHIGELHEWMSQTETVLSTGPSASGFGSLHEQFSKYDRIIQNLIDKASFLRSSGKIDCARKLDYQLENIKNRFDELHNKYRQLQRPTDFEPRLARCRQQLNDVDARMHEIDIRSDDVEHVQSQLDGANRLYAQLSDLKPEIEQVIKQGRAIVDRRQTDRPDETSHELDRLKHQFNDLGARVTTAKENLECAVKCLRKFHSELALVLEWIRKSENEFHKMESSRQLCAGETLSSRSAASDEQLEWIRSTRVDIRKLDSNFQILHSLQRDIERRADKPLISLSDRVNDAQRRVDQFCKRLKERSTILEDQYEKCESDYQRFQSSYHSIQVLIDKVHTDLSSTSLSSVSVLEVNRIADTLHRLRSQIDQLGDLGRNLGSRSEHFSQLAMSDLDIVCRRYDDLKDRYNNLVDKREYHHHQQQQQQQHYQRKDDRSVTTTDDEDPNAGAPGKQGGGEEDEFRRKYARCLAYLQLIDKLVSKGTLPDDAHADLTYLRDDFSSRHVIDREMIERVIKETERTIHVIEHREPSRAKKLKSMLSRLEDQVRRIELKLDNVCQDHPPPQPVKLDKGVDEVAAPPSTTDGYESSDFLYGGAAAGDDHRSVVSEPSTTRLSRLDKWMQQQSCNIGAGADQFRLQPLLRVRSLRAIGGRAGRSATSFNQSLDRRYRRAMSTSRPLPPPVQQPMFYYPAAVPCFPYMIAGAGGKRPMMYRERIVDKHTATRHYDASAADQDYARTTSQTTGVPVSQSYRVRQVPVISSADSGTHSTRQQRFERSSSASRYYHRQHNQQQQSSPAANMTSGGAANAMYSQYDRRQ